MLHNIPSGILKVGEMLPQAQEKPIVHIEEKIERIKKKFNLTHGPGKSKHKNNKKKKGRC